VRSRVGYSGGRQDSPSYHDLKDHTETLQLQYDPAVISYRELLEIFWASHDYATPIKAQYKSAIYYHTEEQRRLAEATRNLVRQGRLGQAEHRGKPILTAIEPATPLYVAELYHQKYTLQCNADVVKHLKYAGYDDIVDDTLACRLNGYLAGHGDLSTLLEEIDSFDLPFAVKFHLLRVVTSGNTAGVVPINETAKTNPLPLDYIVQQRQHAAFEGKDDYVSSSISSPPEESKDDDESYDDNANVNGKASRDTADVAPPPPKRVKK